MLINTTRFGTIDVDESRIIEFREGLLGFPECKRFSLIQTTNDPVFFWLQSVEAPDLAFVVCDPLAFVPDYQVPIRKEDVANLDFADATDHQVMVIVNKVDGQLTGNLLGPLVIGATSKKARQLVLTDKRFSTRYPLMPAPQQQKELAAAQSA